MSTESLWDDQLHALGKKLLTHLFMLLKTAGLYETNNAAFVSSIESLEDDLQSFLQRTGECRLESMDGNIFINDEKIKSDIYTYSTFEYLESEFKKRGIGGILFTSQPTKQELTKFIAIFNSFKVSGEDALAKFNELITQSSVQSISVVEQRSQVVPDVDEDTVTTNKASAVRNYIRAVQLVKEAVTRFDEKKGFDARKAKRIVYNLVQHSSDEGYSFVGLASIKNYDAYTFHHCVNVCVIAITFGQNLGLSKRQLADLGIGALYHDIGKLNIPKEVLNKPSGFTDEEWHLMKQHPVMAVQHLLPLRGASDIDIKKVVPAFEHHRNYDLSGYPAATIRKPLNFYSKVVAICDAFDAMTSSRVYQKARMPSEALQIILKGAGKQFDPVLVKAFINTMGIYPVGSLVQLSDGYLGIVTEVHKDLAKSERPKVSVMMDPQGNLRREKLIDLADPASSSLSIVRVVDPEKYKVNVAYYLLGV